MLRGEVLQHGDVGTGAEPPLAAGEDHRPHGAIGRELRDDAEELIDHVQGDRVDGGTVEDDGGDLPGPLDGEVRRRSSHRVPPGPGRHRPQPPLT